jgi:hypothetical protein
MKQVLYVLLALLLGSVPAYSQVPDTPPAPEQTPAAPVDSSQAPATNEEAPTEPQTEPQAEADIASEPEPEEGDDAASRFIPTEQISQDLGVSFPADI